jgi:hypothetical protein
MCYGNVIGCGFTGNSAFNGGAANIYTGIIERCNFESNIAENAGGAVVFSEGGSFAYCSFKGNTAFSGGAISMFTGNIENCNFTGNNATEGSAINFNGFSGTNISNSIFLNNRANASADNPFNVTAKGNSIEIAFIGQNNLLNAICSNGDVSFTNVTYWGAGGIENTGDNTIILSPSSCEAGQNISVTGFVNGKTINTTNLTDDNGKIILEDASDYCLIVRHESNSYYTEAEETFSNMNVNVTSKTTTNRTVNITAESNIPEDIVQGRLVFILPNGDEINATYGADGIWWVEYTFDEYADYIINATYIGLDDVTINNATISIVKANSTVDVSSVVLNYGESKDVTVKAEGATGITAMIDNKPVNVINNYTITISGLDAGTHTLTVTTIADGDHEPVSKTVTVTVNRLNTQITAGEITATYNINSDLVITLKDSTGKALSGVSITVDLNGLKTYTTDASGQVKVPTKGLIPKTYTAKITFPGNTNYADSFADVKVIVKKATPKIIAKKKTYKAKAKTKKFTITLKDNLGKPIKNAKVTIKVKKITKKAKKKKTKSTKKKNKNTAKTNKKGKATFKIDRKTKGKYWVTVKYKGNKYYTKATKKVKITLK